MKWTYHLEKKVKIAISLTGIIVLVLATNLINRNYFTKLQSSFASVYQDRLLVENYVYKLSSLLNERRWQLSDTVVESQGRQYVQQSNAIFNEIIAKYQQTKFTNREVVLFNDFKVKLDRLTALETHFYKSQTKETKAEIARIHRELSELLEGLSDIQVAEGESLMNQSNGIISMSYFLSRIEIILLIIVAIIIHILVLSSKSIISKFPQGSQLN